VDTSLVELTYLSGGANLKGWPERLHQRHGRRFSQGHSVGQVMDSRPVEFGLYTERA